MGQKGHETGMAGEFHVMETLYRLGHEPALTLGNAKTIDILTRSKCGNKHFDVSVKAIRGKGRGGKWGLGSTTFAEIQLQENLIFVLLRYEDFNNLLSPPKAWIIPAEKLKDMDGKELRDWHKGQKAIYDYKRLNDDLSAFQDDWGIFKCSCEKCTPIDS